MPQREHPLRHDILVFHAYLSDSICIHIKVQLECFHGDMLVIAVHIVVLPGEFSAESHSTGSIVYISYAAFSDTAALFTLDPFVDPQQCLYEIAVFIVLRTYL